MRHLLAAVCITLALATAARADLKITVDPGDSDRAECPVTLQIPLADAEGLKGGVILMPTNPKESRIGQVHVVDGKNAELMWVSPPLKAKSPVTYTVRPARITGDSFQFTDTPGYRDILFGKTPVARYMDEYDPKRRDETFKPYLHVFGFHDDGFITKGPGGQFTHHRGMFFGYKTQDGDFWHCPKEYQKHEAFVKDVEFAGPVAARFASVVDWITKDEKTVVKDTRQTTIWKLADGKWLYDWAITVQPIDHAADLGGDPQHAGFHFRASNEVSTGGFGGTATYVMNDGAVKGGSDVWKDTTWTAASFKIKNNPYTVMLMDAPDNPRPTVFSTRPYAREGAFLEKTADKKPPRVEVDKPLTLHYRVIVFDGKDLTPSTALLAPYFADYAKPVKVTVAKG